FNAVTGTSANPGRFATSDSRAHRWDHGTSWSASLTQHLPGNIHPYVTYAKSSIVLDANNNALTNIIINAGHLGASTLAEAGLKVSAFRDRVFFAVSAYRQARADTEYTDDINVINAYAGSTRTEGIEFELKLVPTRNWQLSLYGLEQKTYYDPNVSSTLLVDARTLGFQDVLDAQGNVIYPAEAFLYGGRSRIVLPANSPLYREKQGNPHLQIGLNSLLRLPAGFSMTIGGNYFSETCSGRLCVVTLPDSYVFNAGVLWNRASWSGKLDVLNLTNERYFRARTGDTLGDVLAQAMPDRHWQVSVRKKF
ncbi:MAG TPA: hypothetical protein VK629_03575, partial [Steroidobacteraceae bacterium]|nr:hypothetical protein [Steroidobacteraceae bacterium]